MLSKHYFTYYPWRRPRAKLADTATLYQICKLMETWFFAVGATYIVNILLGRMAVRENIEIIGLMTHLWRQAKLYYKMNTVWVKGHSGHAGNDLADRLAVSAGMADGKERWWVRDFLLNDWGQAEYIKLCTSYFPEARKDTLKCQQCILSPLEKDK